MRGFRFAIAWAAASALALSPTLTAFAASAVLTVGAVGGANVAVGDILASSLANNGSATFTNAARPSQVLSCSSQFAATVTSNPTAPDIGTGATATLPSNQTPPSLRFTNCMISGVPGVTGVKQVVVNALPYTVSILSNDEVTIVNATSGSSLSVTATVVVLGSNENCTYTAKNNNGGTVSSNITGTASNNGNTITFTKQAWSKAAGPGECFDAANFDAVYGAVHDQTQGSQNVFVQ